MSSGRVTQRLENGGNRRSPRFPSAADPSAKSTRSTSRLCRRSQSRKERSIGVSYVDQDSHGSGDDFSGHVPSESRRRSKKRKSLNELDNDGWARDDGRDESNGEMEVKSSPSQQLLEKSLLELVIDILQRRDTYEAFGEPVDPDEVADYYAVVKEPMDFGTMRAKLHEGLYTSIDEFEHDAFLIPKNAMLFNSPSSVYFKQAQAIEELAKKAFHLLKTEPEKLRTEFSETRRRSRRLPPEPINGKRKRGGSTQPNMSTSLSSNSHHRPSMSTYMHTDKAYTQSFSLIGVTCSDKDARSTYQPWIYFSRESGSIVSPFYRSSNYLEKVDERKMHYKDSLMRFAQGLEPVAQKIVARKLQPQAKVPTCFQVQIGEKPNAAAGIGIARRGNKTHMGEKRNSQVSRFEKVPARGSHHGGIILALRSEDTAKGKQNLLGDGTVNPDFVTGLSTQPGELKPIQNGINGANLSMRTDLSKTHCMGHHGSQPSNKFQRDLAFSRMSGTTDMPEHMMFSKLLKKTESTRASPFLECYCTESSLNHANTDGDDLMLSHALPQFLSELKQPQ